MLVLAAAFLVLLIVIKYVSSKYRDDYRIVEKQEKLGSGHFGEVYKAIIKKKDHSEKNRQSLSKH